MMKSQLHLNTYSQVSNLRYESWCCKGADGFSISVVIDDHLLCKHFQSIKEVWKIFRPHFSLFLTTAYNYCLHRTDF